MHTLLTPCADQALLLVVAFLFAAYIVWRRKSVDRADISNAVALHIAADIAAFLIVVVILAFIVWRVPHIVERACT